jgi:hypothetical protein
MAKRPPLKDLGLVGRHVNTKNFDPRAEEIRQRIQQESEERQKRVDELNDLQMARLAEENAKIKPLKFQIVQPDAVEPDAVEPAAPAKGSKPRHVQVRINDAGWEALKVLAAVERHTVQQLMLEALNDLFRKYGRAPMADGPE